MKLNLPLKLRNFVQFNQIEFDSNDLSFKSFTKQKINKQFPQNKSNSQRF
jgi:hypothetical protein